ncbi:hypothetical protein [Nocardioides euryhalodurans]|uniref:Ig-like domain-containing protein n=1 Tax=Nocardioides euryhalodurans TaxID=2518370 RepID=A0A4P7GL90_9ACTN|nr:hypothetical protein [Nocardioides euryhalodurans]QBR92856.1 hypothetical protein EXE57_11640 [Nocardioides euryhalodurans]
MSVTSSRLRMLASTGAALGVAVWGLAVPAHAVAPPNDTPAGAIEIATVPATIEAGTRQATTDLKRRPCVFGRSIWYRYRPTATATVRMVTIGSSFDTVLAVHSGGAKPRTLLACNDDAAGLASAVRPMLTAGQHYWIAVSSCCGSSRAPGGDLVLRLYEGGSAAAVELTVDRAEAGSVSGRIRLHGTATCATPSVVWSALVASQRIDAQVARGSTELMVRECTTTPTEWTVRVDSETGWAFRPGTVAVDVRAEGDDGFSRDVVEIETSVVVDDGPLRRRS